MKIFKVTLDPSNPVEKIVKVPVGSNYGIQINWNYEKYPTFVGTDINTENGFLTDSLGKIEENTSFTEVNGQKIFTGLHVIEEVGNTIVLYYGKNETYDDNKLDNFGSIKVVGIDSDDYDVDVGGGDATIEGLYNDEVGYGIGVAGSETNITIGNLNGDTSLSSINIGGDRIGLRTSSSMINIQDNQIVVGTQGELSLNGTIKFNGEEYQAGVVDGLYNIPIEVGTEFELMSSKTVYKTIPESASILSWSVPSDIPTNAIITFWLWIVMGDTAHELTFPTSVTFIDNAPTLAANTETMLALTSTDGGTTWLANTQWVK